MGVLVLLGIMGLLVGLVGGLDEGLDGGLGQGLKLEYSLDSSTEGFQPVQGGQLVLQEGGMSCTLFNDILCQILRLTPPHPRPGPLPEVCRLPPL